MTITEWTGYMGVILIVYSCLYGCVILMFYNVYIVF